MITLKNIHFSIFGKSLFKDISFTINKGDRIGLVGPNGSGKSTLLKIIMREAEPDSGIVHIQNEQIEYLPQEIDSSEDDTLESFLNVQYNNPKQILKMVELDHVPLNYKVKDLSGGQKTRLSLAKVLLTKPTVLLLDEPTNHLDIRALEWLESFINHFNGSVCLISHDRKFLDTTVNKILEIDSHNQTFKEYTGGYTQYLVQKENDIAIQQSAYERQQKEKRRLELWLALKKQEATVYANPTKGRQIRAMEKRIEREIYSQTIRRPQSRNIQNISLSGEVHSVKLICTLKNVSKHFNTICILKDISFEIRGRDKILLTGTNGSGKTTLIKILAGQYSADTGEITTGNGVRIGYFSQEHEDLNPDKTVIDEFTSAQNILTGDPRKILGRFLFTGSDVFKKVSILSAGERVRLIFAKLTNSHNELLLLDEPTNHLDIATREVIEEALLHYQGSIIAISHDRYFIEKMRFNRIFLLQDSKLKEQ